MKKFPPEKSRPCEEAGCSAAECWLVTGDVGSLKRPVPFVDLVRLCAGCPVFLEAETRGPSSPDWGCGLCRELVPALDEAVTVLNRTAEGEPNVKMSEASGGEAVTRLRTAVDNISGQVAEMVELSHEMAIALAEQFDVLHRVGEGDLDARVGSGGKQEILQYLSSLTNSTIGRLADEIKSRRATEQELSKLATAVEQIAECVVIITGRGDCEYANPAFLELSGYTRSEIIGHPVKVFDSEGEIPGGSFAEMSATVRMGGVWRGTINSRRKDGGVYLVEATVSPVRNETGKIIKYVIVMRDVSKEIEIQKRLEQSRKLEALGTLSGGIAHELNNILTPIIGYTELVLDDGEYPPRVKKNLQQILVASERAREILWKILAFSRSEEEGEEVTGINISSVVRETIDLFSTTVPPSIKLEMECFLGKDELALIGITPLQQVLLNLATNAVAAMPGRKGTIKIILKEPGPLTIAKFMKDPVAERYLELVVSDDGSGIDPDNVSRIFEPFYTTKPVGQGTGLGLSVVHGILRNAGGFINVESEPGKGTSFHIFIPRLAPADWGGVVQPEVEPMPRGKGERILLVDDEETVVNVFRLQLQGLGYKVEAFTQPTAALAAFLRTPSRFDLLLSDNSMPMMSGVVLASEARMVRPGLPVIICTGFKSAIPEEQLEEMKDVIFLDKPVMVRELAAGVRAALEGKTRDE